MNDNQIKYDWRKLILFFERMNYIHNGLTIPFLIGSIKLLEGKSVTISEFITELIDSENENRTTIMKCGNIGEYVIGIMDMESELYYHKFPKSLFVEFNNLAVKDNSLNNCKSIEDLITFMEGRYCDKVENEKYSKNAGKWTYFTTEELEKIDNYKFSLK